MMAKIISHEKKKQRRNSFFFIFYTKKDTNRLYPLCEKRLRKRDIIKHQLQNPTTISEPFPKQKEIYLYKSSACINLP